MVDKTDDDLEVEGIAEALEELKGALAELEMLERRWLELPEEVRLAHPELAKFFVVKQ